jgi:hypothetical protein
VALNSDAAAEKSKDQLSRDFPGRSIFDFCNNICQKRTRPCIPLMDHPVETSSIPVSRGIYLSCEKKWRKSLSDSGDVFRPCR